MLFNSIDFAYFLPIVFFIYWLIPREKINIQNMALLIASYIFYGWWNWHFLILLFFSSVSDYIISLKIISNQKHKKTLLITSIIINLGILGFFKYYNFFIESFIDTFRFFGHTFNTERLNIILPVGISFYTFQTMSYTIDVYRNKINPTQNAISFLAFVSFFPQLVAGPIERATNLLPQFLNQRKFQYQNAVLGSRQILWGLFKKIVIADNSAKYANLIFNNYTDYHWSILILGSCFFAFQIYGDFSGYSDIAIGTSRLFGFSLMNNFKFPYFSRNVADFWRRWHISLTTWFRDYLYIPLGGSKFSTLRTIRNTFIVFIVSGFWHGANLTFIFWGLAHALLFIPLLLLGSNRKYIDNLSEKGLWNTTKQLLQISITFLIISITWIFFRSQNITEALNYYQRIFLMDTGQTVLWRFPMEQLYFLIYLLLLTLFIMLEWINKENTFGLEKLTKSTLLRWSLYLTISSFIFLFSGETSNFIYFQF